MIPKYIFTLNSTFDKARDRITLLKCIRWVIYENLPLADCVRLTDRVIFGESIEVDRYYKEGTMFPGFFDVFVHKEAEPYDEYEKQLLHKKNLLTAGANGDAEAAIAYCKLIRDNRADSCICGGGYA